MERFNIRTQAIQTLQQLVARVLALAQIRPLPDLVQRIPWLAEFPADHLRITKLAMYRLVTAALQFVVVLVQAVPTLAAALLRERCFRSCKPWAGWRSTRSHSEASTR